MAVNRVHIEQSAIGSNAAQAARLARRASRKLAMLSAETRNAALLRAAENLEKNSAKILAANQRDLQAAGDLLRTGEISSVMLARLKVTPEGVAEMAEKVRGVARLSDPLGRSLAVTEMDQGLILTKESCPLGVVAVVFESRPDVVPQVASLALKSGNAILLKGGAEASYSNEALMNIWRATLAESGDIPDAAALMLHSRADVADLLGLARDVDLLIPRGGRSFVEQISRHSRIPVLGHGEGICHVYVHAAADVRKAERIVLDAKLDYPAACNAEETLLVDQGIAADFLPPMIARLLAAGVELRGCERTCRIAGSGGLLPAGEQDWAAEYGDLILAIKVVDGIEAAISHIHEFGSAHTEAIVTEDALAAEKFLAEVDAAGVFHNASTRFADGYRYGLGAEVGVSNGKLHARGPMGLEGLTTYKYKLRGSGQTVSDYYHGKRFTHRRL